MHWRLMARLSIAMLSVSAVRSFVSRTSPILSRAASASSSASLVSFLGKRNNGISNSNGQIGRLSRSLSSTADATAEATASLAATTVVADSADFTKPDRDAREYRYIKLPNNLEVLLVSTSKSNGDESSAVEAASIHVQAGHFDDTIPGLAHFHEHMLFLGTEKYPSEDEYESFLSKFGGFGNAYTDMEDTNYYFSVTTQTKDGGDTTSEGLAGGLDRLAQFFIAPKFESSMVERELRAIDSEYRNYRTSDAWRNYQFLKAVSNPKHPFSNFGCGNYETLTSQGSPESELKRFWETYYKTTNMRLAVVGSSSLDSLQRTVEETFGNLQRSDDPHRRVKVNPEAPVFPREHAVYDPHNPAFGSGQIGQIREVVPLIETRTLKIMFATPPMDDPVLRQSKPHRVLSHLLGHESPGSLHSVLNDLGYVVGLSSGTAIDASDFSLFSLSLALTPKGMASRNEVMDLVFQYLTLIKRTALENPELMTEYHEELRMMSANQFKFRENGDPTDFCTSAADLMFDDVIPKNELLAAGVNCGDYDPVIAKAFMKRLSPGNCMVTITDSGLKVDESEGWKTERWYGANYRETPIAKEQIEAWENPESIHPEMHVPGLNKFIPSDFSLRCDDNPEQDKKTGKELEATKKNPPKIIYETTGFRMWHKMDQFWRVPKTVIRLSLVSPKPYESPRSMTLNRIFQRVLSDDLNSFVYDASMAGCNYRVTCAPNGYKISVRGYSEKLPSLLDTLTTRIESLLQEMKEGGKAHPGLEARFQKAKDNLLRETKNYRLDGPNEICNYNSRLMMEENVWYLDNYVDEMEGEMAEKHPLTLEECATVAEQSLTERIKGDAICMGNVDEAEAKKVLDVVQRHFLDKSRPLKDTEIPQFKSMKLPTRQEAMSIFGPGIEGVSVPVKYQELAYSDNEENNAVEMTLQAGCDLTLGYEGIGMIDLIASMAYNSAYAQLRTKEQLGYTVSAYARKTTGSAWGMTVLVQSSSTSPEVLEQRIEAWLKTFRGELEEMDPAAIAAEAQGVVAQLKEGPTNLSSEGTSFWGEIVATQSYDEQTSTPPFDRLDQLADEVTIAMDGDDDAKSLSPKTISGNDRKTPESLKAKILEVFDTYFSVDAPERRGMISRVYNHSSSDAYEESLSSPGVMSTYSEIRNLKQYLSTWPVAPYWRMPSKEDK